MSDSPQEQLTIGALADRTGLPTSTIRYYEKIGVLPRPTRTSTGYRQYPLSTVETLFFVKHAQLLGFSLNEITALLSWQGEASCSAGNALVKIDGKINGIDRAIEKLSAARESLVRCRKACPLVHKGATCAVSSCAPECCAIIKQIAVQ